jgi:hypothetical protein
MRKIILILSVVVGAIVLMNLSQIASAFADEGGCMACKAQAQGQCMSISPKATPEAKRKCVSDYIAKNCAEKCQKGSGKGD